VRARACASVCVRARVCRAVCVCARAYVYRHTLMYIYSYTCVYACKGGHMVLSCGYKVSNYIILRNKTWMFVRVANMATIAVLSRWRKCMHLL
jgi:hypothetical protein